MKLALVFAEAAKAELSPQNVGEVYGGERLVVILASTLAQVAIEVESSVPGFLRLAVDVMREAADEAKRRAGRAKI